MPIYKTEDLAQVQANYGGTWINVMPPELSILTVDCWHVQLKRGLYVRLIQS